VADVPLKENSQRDSVSDVRDQAPQKDSVEDSTPQVQAEIPGVHGDDHWRCRHHPHFNDQRPNKATPPPRAAANQSIGEPKACAHPVVVEAAHKSWQERRWIDVPALKV